MIRVLPSFGGVVRKPVTLFGSLAHNNHTQPNTKPTPQTSNNSNAIGCLLSGLFLLAAMAVVVVFTSVTGRRPRDRYEPFHPSDPDGYTVPVHR